MVKVNFKRIVALTMATAMVVGSGLTAFAADNGEGAGTFEGAKPSFPTFSLTLPTLPDADFAYIADPNGLIAATSSERYANATWSNTAQGIFFANTAVDGKIPHSENSNAMKVTNNNFNGVIVTCKLEEKTAGAGTTMVSSSDFKDTDTDKKVYFALTDGTNTSLGATAEAPATIKTYIAGKPSNYSLKWDATANDNAGGYAITAKTGDDLKAYNEYSCYVTGALNKNATWAAGSAFPTIKVTWAIQQNVTPVKVVKGATASATLHDTDQKTIKSVTAPSLKFTFTTAQCARTNPDGTNAGTITIASAVTDGYFSAFAGDGLNVLVTYSDNSYEYVTFVQ